jgi:putative salt-induced outer membrane protein YdiY
MVHMRHLPLFLTLGLLSAGNLVAQATEATPPKKIEFTGDLSLVAATGNSELTTFGAADKLVYHADTRWMFTQSAKATYGTDDGGVSAENYAAGLRADFAFAARAGAYALFAFDRDVFSGIAARYETSAGLIAKVVDAAKDKLQFEAGLGWISQRPTVNPSQQFLSGRAAAGYRHNFSDASYFEQKLDLIPNLEESADLRMISLTSLVAPISSHIGLKATYQVKYDGMPEPNFVETDTEFRTGIQITF